LLFALAVETGRIGIDFGTHWDELAQLQLVGRSAKSGVLLPEIYNYPCVTYWLATSGVLPFMLDHPNQLFDHDTTDLRNYITTNHAYKMRVRTICLIVSSLSIVWVYLLVLGWRGRVGEAFAAAAFLGLSWELAYHSRWIAPDAVMTSFAAMTVMFAVLSRTRANGRPYLHGAAIAAGLATGTKYQCGMLLLPVLIAAVQTWRPGKGFSALLRPVAACLGLFVLTYSITTPGMWLDPGRFIKYFLLVVRHYQGGGHLGYDVAPGPEHFGKLLAYFGRDFFSPYPIAGVVVGLLSLVGAWAIWRSSRSVAVVFLSFPVAFIAFMSTQRVLVVRNVLPIAPFVAVAAARGVTEVLRRIHRPAGRTVVIAAVATILCANAVWLGRAAYSIRRATPDTALADLSNYVSKQPPQRIYASAPVLAGLRRLGLDTSRFATSVAKAEDLAVYPDDWVDMESRPCNIPGVLKTWFGPAEVNWTYYTSWMGFQHILLIPKSKAEALGHPFKG